MRPWFPSHDPQGSARPSSFGKARASSSCRWCGLRLREQAGSLERRSAGPGTAFFPDGKRKSSRLSPNPRYARPQDSPWPNVGRRRIRDGKKGLRKKVNVIVGAKGSGKSHLAKVILLGLIRAGAPCLVLDVNREYGGLPGVRTYGVGKDFKLGVREIGVEAMFVMLEAFGTPATSLLYFETRLTKLLQERKEFIGIDELISMAGEGEFYPTQSGYAADAVNRTLRSRLEALKLTGMVARGALEASSFAGVWKGIREGGAGCLIFPGFPRRRGWGSPRRFCGSSCARGGGRKGSVRVLRGSPSLRNPAGDRCPGNEGEAHRDHELLHYEHTHSASGRGFTGGGQPVRLPAALGGGHKVGGEIRDDRRGLPDRPGKSSASTCLPGS